MSRPLSIALLICLMTGLDPAMAQPSAPSGRAQTRAGRGARPLTPTRDPNTPGYVKAKELPDGAIPSPKEDGNFIIGPTHNPAPEMTVQEGVPQGQIFEFTMESKDSKIYPGIAREPNTFAAARSGGPQQADRQQPPCSLHAPGGGVCPQAIRPRHGGAVHRRRGWTGPGIVHRARQSDRRAPGAGDDRDLHRQRQRRRTGQPARTGVRHDVRPVRGVRREGSAAAGGEAIQRQADQGSRRPGDDGLQLRRLRRRWRWRGITRISTTAF